MAPELFTLPVLGNAVWAYGTMLFLAFAFGLWIAVRLAGQDGLPARKIYDLGLILIPTALVGAQLLKIADRGPIAVQQMLRGGSGSYSGGFILAVAASMILIRQWRLPWRRVADACAPSLALGYALARLGCFLAGCCWGGPTASKIGVIFTERAHELTGVPIDRKLLPTQLIESIASLLFLGILLWIGRHRHFTGQVFLLYVLWYSVARFAIEFWRDTPRPLWGLSVAQLVSVAMFPVGLIAYQHYRRGSSRETALQDARLSARYAGSAWVRLPVCSAAGAGATLLRSKN